MSATTGTWNETMFCSRASFTAVASSSSEASLLAAVSPVPFTQPVIPALFFMRGGGGYGITVILEAEGILGTTSTPTIIFQLRLGTTNGSSYLSGTSVGVSATITTQSGVSAVPWYLRMPITCNQPGIGSGALTLQGTGSVRSPAGFAAPYEYSLIPTQSSTLTATIDGSVTQYANLSITWGTSSSSNTCTCTSLRMYGIN